LAAGGVTPFAGDEQSGRAWRRERARTVLRRGRHTVGGYLDSTSPNTVSRHLDSTSPNTVSGHLDSTSPN
ncbi:MAG TPA: hypothetical protein VE127_06770, partial [Solirubrobacteraceae bacterium]|nr:hypothetical protein [Solirubrobacteraceae bacterium]